MENKNTKAKKENLHKGHRARVRQKFIKDGSLDNFQDHEILEFLLFYAYPMKDTNEMAHKLLEEYGSLYNLFNTPVNNLMDKTGLTENAAVLLCLIQHANKRFLMSEFNNRALSSSKRAGKYMMSVFNGQNYESFYLICLNLKKKIISVDEMDKGDADSVRMETRKIIEKALLYRAKFVIIGHNHPAGTNKPSPQDVAITKRIKTELEMIGVILLDHIVVTVDNYYSFCENKLFGLTYNPVMD